MRFFKAMLITLALTTAAGAQEHVDPGTASPYPGAATYADLVRLAVPDLTEIDGRYQGTFATAQPSLIFPDDPPVEGAQASFTDLQALPFTSEGKPHLALLVDSANEHLATDALIVIDLSDPPRLVDFADITADEHTSFGEPARLAVGSGDDGLLITSAHFNSSQGYKTTTLAGVVDGRLQRFASVFTLREVLCGVGREQVASFAPIPILGGRFEPFALTVTESTVSLNDECSEVYDPTFGTRSFATTYSWNDHSLRYEPDSTVLDELYAETEKRF